MRYGCAVLLINFGLAPLRYRMDSLETFLALSWVLCSKPLEIGSAVADEKGSPVHRQCYSSRMCDELAQRDVAERQKGAR